MFSLGVRWIWAVTSSQFYWWCYILFAGTWRVSLDPVEAGGPYSVTAVTQSSTATLTDVLFGDVWLCGGQSNMYFKTSEVKRLRSVTSTWTDSLRGRETKAFHSSIILTLYLLMCSLCRFLTHLRSWSWQQSILTSDLSWSPWTWVTLSWLIWLRWNFPGLCPQQVRHRFIDLFIELLTDLFAAKGFGLMCRTANEPVGNVL